MGFNWIFLNPFHECGFSGSLYAVKDYYRLNPLFRGGRGKTDDAILAEFTDVARQHDLSVMMDLVINHTAKDSILVGHKPDWFVYNPDGSLWSPRAVDPVDPTLFTEWGDLAEINYAERPERDDIVAYWQAVVEHYLDLGFRGFRGDAAYKVPAVVWRDVIAAARSRQADTVFFAETLGCRPNEVTALHDAGFDYVFNSSKWWDFKAPWLLEQYEIFRRIAPSISFPESHDTDRLMAELAREGVTDRHRAQAAYRERYLFSAVFSTGLMIPMGFEYGFRQRLDVVKTRPGDWEDPAFDLSDFIAETNRIKSDVPALNEEGPQSHYEAQDPNLVVLDRATHSGDSRTLTIVNTDRNHDRTVTAQSLIDRAGLSSGVEITPGHHRARLEDETALRLDPSEVRVFAGEGRVGAWDGVESQDPRG